MLVKLIANGHVQIYKYTEYMASDQPKVLNTRKGQYFHF